MGNGKALREGEKKNKDRHRRDGSVVEGAGCSSRGPEFIPRTYMAFCNYLQLQLQQIQCLCLTFTDTTWTWCTDIHRDKIPMHIKKKITKR